MELYRQLKGGGEMGFLGFVFFSLLGFIAVVVSIRSAKFLIRMVNNLFNKIENKFG